MSRANRAGDTPSVVSDASDVRQNTEDVHLDVASLTTETFHWSTYQRQLARSQATGTPEVALDFLVISAGRTGTTWLAEQLRRHPGVFVPPQKEIHYFSLQWQRHDLAWYSNIFRDAAAGQMKGEISPSYACLPSFAIRFIAERYPNLKLILLARRPHEHTWSQTRHAFRQRDSTFRHVTRSLESLPDELILSHFLSDHVLTASDTIGIIQRWRRYFPLRQFHISYFEDVVAKPGPYLRSLFEFLTGSDCAASAFEETATERVNEGIHVAEPRWAAEVLSDIHDDRQRRTEVFLAQTFGLASPWNPATRQRDPRPIHLIDHQDGWRIFFFKGEFLAVLRKDLRSAGRLDVLLNDPTADVLRRDFAADLLYAIDHGEVAGSGAGAEDNRLIAVLDVLQRDAASPFRRTVATRNGYSIVQLKDRYYALREDVADIDVTIGDDMLSAEYQDNEVLMSSSLDQLQLHIDLLSAIEEPRHPESHASGRAAAAMAPVVADTYNGFNIVRLGHKVYAVRQAIGVVDFTVGAAQLLRTYAPVDLVAGNSIAGVRRKIDAIQGGPSTGAIHTGEERDL